MANLIINNTYSNTNYNDGQVLKAASLNLNYIQTDIVMHDLLEWISNENTNYYDNQYSSDITIDFDTISDEESVKSIISNSIKGIYEAVNGTNKTAMSFNTNKEEIKFGAYNDSNILNELLVTNEIIKIIHNHNNDQAILEFSNGNLKYSSIISGINREFDFDTLANFIDNSYNSKNIKIKNDGFKKIITVDNSSNPSYTPFKINNINEYNNYKDSLYILNSNTQQYTKASSYDFTINYYFVKHDTVIDESKNFNVSVKNETYNFNENNLNISNLWNDTINKGDTSQPNVYKTILKSYLNLGAGTNEYTNSNWISNPVLKLNISGNAYPNSSTPSVYKTISSNFSILPTDYSYVNNSKYICKIMDDDMQSQIGTLEFNMFEICLEDKVLAYGDDNHSTVIDSSTNFYVYGKPIAFDNGMSSYTSAIKMNYLYNNSSTDNNSSEIDISPFGIRFKKGASYSKTLDFNSANIHTYLIILGTASAYIDVKGFLSLEPSFNQLYNSAILKDNIPMVGGGGTDTTYVQYYSMKLFTNKITFNGISNTVEYTDTIYAYLMR